MKTVMIGFVSYIISSQLCKLTSHDLLDEVIELISERELDVMRLIAQDASKIAFAEQLVVNLGTVKKHTNNIFIRLGVSS